MIMRKIFFVLPRKVIELAPGINPELDAKGELICVELPKASELLKDAVIHKQKGLKSPELPES